MKHAKNPNSLEAALPDTEGETVARAAFQRIGSYLGGAPHNAPLLLAPFGPAVRTDRTRNISVSDLERGTDGGV